MRIGAGLLLIVALGASCEPGEERAAAPPDTLTRAQRDSIIAASSLPGAGTVRRALDTRDSANARGAAMDTLPR